MHSNCDKDKTYREVSTRFSAIVSPSFHILSIIFSWNLQDNKKYRDCFRKS